MGRGRILIAAALLLCGCNQIAQRQGESKPVEPAPGRGQLLPGSQIRGSGFLGSYAQLKSVTGTPGEWEYVKPGVNWKPYDTIAIRPMEVWLNPAAEYAAIQPQIYSQIEGSVREIVIREFEAGGYKVVDQAAPGVLVFHYALTGVTPMRQGLDPTDVIPIKAAVTAVRYATGTEPYYIALSGEMEVLDGGSGERVYAMVGARRSFATTLKGRDITWSELRDDVTFFARQWRTRLDAARGRPAS
jgi:hypothetical protein